MKIVVMIIERQQNHTILAIRKVKFLKEQYFYYEMGHSFHHLIRKMFGVIHTRDHKCIDIIKPSTKQASSKERERENRE